MSDRPDAYKPCGWRAVTAVPSRPVPKRSKPPPTCPTAIAERPCASLGATSGRSRRMAGVVPAVSAIDEDAGRIQPELSGKHCSVISNIVWSLDFRSSRR